MATRLPELGCLGLRICLYPDDVDRYVSTYIRTTGAWEPEITLPILSAMEKYPSAIFLDIGANVGMHSLSVARFGRRVVAVEPKLSTIKRLHKSVNLNRLADRYTLVTNAVSNARQTMTLRSDVINPGASSLLDNKPRFFHEETVETILMDDLLEVLPADITEIVMKIDVEGFEARAFANASKLLSSGVKIQAVFMEWVHMQRLLSQPGDGDDDAVATTDGALVRAMVAKLRQLGLQPFSVLNQNSGFDYSCARALNDFEFAAWPIDVVWVRTTTPPAVNLTTLLRKRRS